MKTRAIAREVDAAITMLKATSDKHKLEPNDLFGFIFEVALDEEAIKQVRAKQSSRSFPPFATAAFSSHLLLTHHRPCVACQTRTGEDPSEVTDQVNESEPRQEEIG